MNGSSNSVKESRGCRGRDIYNDVHSWRNRPGHLYSGDKLPSGGPSRRDRPTTNLLESDKRRSDSEPLEVNPQVLRGMTVRLKGNNCDTLS